MSSFSKTVKNSSISVLSQILTMILQFVNRRIFVIFLDLEYLGYQSVFGNIFTILSVAELGVEGIISFHLYEELATDNEEEIGKLMFLYKWIYRIIAVSVTILGLIAGIFIPLIVNDATKDISYLYTVYFMQLGGIVAGYFLSYRRTIFSADQREYVTVEIDLIVYVIAQIVQLSLLAVFKNYIVYLAIQLTYTSAANLIIFYKSNGDYKYLKDKYKITKEDIKRRNIVTDMKNFLVTRIAYVIYGGTDNIVISSFCGIKNAALYGNYYVIHNGIYNLVAKRLLNPIQAAIGREVYSGQNKKSLWDQFETIDLCSLFFSSFMSVGFAIFFQPVIYIWMGGKDFLLPNSFIIAYSTTIYLLISSEITYKYRCVFGDYKKDRNYMVVSAVLNVSISIVLAGKYGVTGVQIGSLIAFIPIWYSRILFVVKGFFEKSLKKYLTKQIFYFCTVFLEVSVSFIITKDLPINFWGIIIRMTVCVLMPTAINTLISFRSPYFNNMCRYIAKLTTFFQIK